MNPKDEKNGTGSYAVPTTLLETTELDALNGKKADELNGVSIGTVVARDQLLETTELDGQLKVEPQP